MEKRFQKLYEQLMKDTKKSRLRRWLATTMAAVVVFATTYSLILPAITADYPYMSEMPGVDLMIDENAYSGTASGSTASGLSGPDNSVADLGGLEINGIEELEEYDAEKYLGAEDTWKSEENGADYGIVQSDGPDSALLNEGGQTARTLRDQLNPGDNHVLNDAEEATVADSSLMPGEPFDEEFDEGKEAETDAKQQDDPYKADGLTAEADLYGADEQVVEIGEADPAEQAAEEIMSDPAEQTAEEITYDPDGEAVEIGQPDTADEDAAEVEPTDLDGQIEEIGQSVPEEDVAEAEPTDLDGETVEIGSSDSEEDAAEAGQPEIDIEVVEDILTGTDEQIEDVLEPEADVTVTSDDQKKAADDGQPQEDESPVDQPQSEKDDEDQSQENPEQVTVPEILIAEENMEGDHAEAGIAVSEEELTDKEEGTTVSEEELQDKEDLLAAEALLAVDSVPENVEEDGTTDGIGMAEVSEEIEQIEIISDTEGIPAVVTESEAPAGIEIQEEIQTDEIVGVPEAEPAVDTVDALEAEPAVDTEDALEAEPAVDTVEVSEAELTVGIVETPENDPESNYETESEAAQIVETEPESEFETEPISEPETESETFLATQTETESDIETEFETAPILLPESETEPDTEAETASIFLNETEIESETETETLSILLPETEIEEGAEFETDPLILTEPESEPETAQTFQPERETEIETEAETSRTFRPEWETDIETEPETARPFLPEWETDLITEPESELSGEELLKLLSEAEPETEPETETEKRFIPEWESEIESKADRAFLEELDRRIAQEAETEPETSLIPETVPELHPGNEPETELETEPETETEKRFIPEWESEIDLLTDSAQDYEPESEPETEFIPEPESEFQTEENPADLTPKAEPAGVAGNVTVEVPGADFILHIAYTEEAGIPENASFVAQLVDDTEYAEQALDLVNNEFQEDEAEQLNLVGLFDLTIYADEAVIAPQAPISIEVEFLNGLEEEETIYAVHFPGTGNQPEDEATAETEPSKSEEIPAPAVEKKTMLKVQKSSPLLMGTEAEEAPKTLGQLAQEEIAVINPSDEGMAEAAANEETDTTPELIETTQNEDIAAFTTTGLSYYAIVSYSQLKKTVISASGETYEITVTYGPEAEIPDGAELWVEEIVPTDEAFAGYFAQAAQTAMEDAGEKGIDVPLITGARLFDIEIRSEGEKIEPSASVQVSIRLVEKTEVQADLQTVVHFAKEGAEAMTLQEPQENADDDRGAFSKIDTENIREISFEAESFSVYTVVDVADFSTVAGNGPYALVTGIAGDPGANVGYGETWGRDYFTKFVNAHAMNYNYGWTNSDGIASMGVHLWEEDSQSYVGGDVTEWYFESNPSVSNGYYIYTLDENGAKRYIYQQGYENYGWHLNRNLAFTLANDKNPETGVDNHWRSTFEIIPNSDGTVLIKNTDGNWYMHNNQYGNNEWESRNYMMDENPGADALSSSPYRFRISKISDQYDSFAARKISVQNVVPDSDKVEYQYIIYHKFIDGEGNETLYALTHDGTFVRVYDGGDTIYWRETDKDIYWKYKESSSGAPRLYYTDEATGVSVYINPSASANQTMMPGEAVSLTFNGKDKGEYGTTIERWDQAAYDYAGLHVTKDGEDVALSAGTRGAGTSDQFLFAVVGEMPSSTQPEDVDTVDSKSLGIHITMFDYGAANGKYNAGDKLASMSQVVNSTIDNNGNYYIAEAYTPHSAHALVKPYLEDGVPSSTKDGAMTGLFTPNGSAVTTYRENVNHLFLQSYYDESGTFRYRSEDNFAYLPGTVNTETGAYNFTSSDFHVYRQAATPYTSNLAVGHTYYHHGHFMPYNNIDMNQNLARLMDQYGNAADAQDLPIGDGRTYENIYGIQGTPNYYTGMMMEAAFSQPRNGKLDNGDDMVFKFTGDDDMWVYIDGVLVLDIGGIHEPLSGTINFATGEVTNPAGSSLPHATTLKAIFDAALADENTPEIVKAKILSIEWNGNTFADYGNHEFKSFYMERGAGASNLDIQFNLKVTLTNQFTVEKELPEGVDTRYSNHKYKYHATFMDGSTEKPLFAGQKNSANEIVCNQVVYRDLKDDNGQPVLVAVDSNGYFYLKPGEVAVFKMKDETIAYNVTEVEIDTAHVDKVAINGVETNHETIISQDNTAVAGYATGRERSNVLFLNYPYLQNLLITKHLTSDSAPLDEGEDPRFEFQVYLETTETDDNGQEVRKMTYYSLAPYYLVGKVDGVEHYFTLTGPNNTPEDKGTEPVVCSTTGRTGTINSIPLSKPDEIYTVRIPKLVVGTHFYVSEVTTPGEIPEGYNHIRTDLTEGTYGESENAVEGDKQGRIIKNKDADAHVYNKKQGIEITARKVWEPSPTDPNASVTIELHRYAKKTKGTIDVILKDTSSIQAAVVGAVFKLQKQDDDGGEWTDTETTVTTDVNGKASVGHLEPGTYRLVQVSAPEGYSMDGHTTRTQPFTVLDNVTTHQEYSETLYNTLLVTSGSLTVKVVDGGNEPVAGAKFTLYMNGAAFQTGLETDENGEINVGGLDAGHYYIVQDQAPEGYYLPDNTTVGTFTVEDGHLGEDQHTNINVTNIGKPKGKVTVTLEKADDFQPISGATILLWQGSSVVETGTTDADGKVVFQTILYAEETYTVQQADAGSAGSDYHLAGDVEIAVDPNGSSNQSFSVTMKDTPRGKGTVTVTVEKDDYTPVSGAAVVLMEGEESFGSGTTDENGQVVFSNVYEGTYTVRQIDTGTAGEGYRLAADETVEITTDGGLNQTKAVTLTDIPKNCGTITVTLVDENNSQTRFSGATIELRLGDTMIETGTTDANGTVTFGSSGTVLYEGIYTVHQASLGNSEPEGYAAAADQEVIIAETGAQNQNLTVTLENGEASGNVTLNIYKAVGTGNWSQELISTISSLKAGRMYQIRLGVSANNIVNGDQAGICMDFTPNMTPSYIPINNADWTNSGDPRYYTISFTPDQDNTTYNIAIVSIKGWGFESASAVLVDEGGNVLNSASPRPASSIRSLSRQHVVESAPTIHSQRDMAASTSIVQNSSTPAILTVGGTQAVVEVIAPQDPPEGYVEDSTFTPISYTLTSSDENWEYTFPAQAKYDADGEPYYYYVVETDCNLDYYELTKYKDDPVGNVDNDTIVITNTRKKGPLNIVKTGTVNSGADTDGRLNGTYTFTVAGVANTPTAGNAVTVKITLTNGTATAAVIEGTPSPSDVSISIDDGVVTLANLPTGVYTVSEVTTGLAAAGINIVGGNPQTVTVTKDPQTIPTATFVNNKDIVSLKLKKKVNNNTGTDTSNQPFDFNITLTAPTGVTFDASYPTIKTPNGGTPSEGTKSVVSGTEFTVTLNGGDTWQINNLPKGTSYSVSETVTSLPPGWTLITTSPQTGTINTAGTVKEVEFTNAYSEVKKAPQVTKVIANRDWQDDEEYTFTIEADSGTTAQAVTDGKIVMPTSAVTKATKEQTTAPFGDIVFKDEGIYYFTIKETPGSDTQHITYSRKEVKVKVVATKTDGVLSAEMTYAEAKADDGTAVAEPVYAVSVQTFTNIYDTSIPAIIGGTKEVTNAAANHDFSAYSFTLAGIRSAPMPSVNTTVNSNAEGAFQFGEIIYTMAQVKTVGTQNGKVYTAQYNYTVTENLPAGTATATQDELTAGYAIRDGIKYDIAPKTVTITVSYDESNGSMSVTANPANLTVEITNEQLGKLQVTKTVKLNGNSDTVHDGEPMTFYVGMFNDTDEATAIEDTVKSITVAAGSSTGTVLYENLPIDSQYYIFETDAVGHKLSVGNKFGGYFVNVNGSQSDPIALTPIVNVDVVNEKRTGDLELTKKIAGNGADLNKVFEFKIALTAAGETLAESYKYTQTGVEGEQTLTLSRTDNNTKAEITGISLKANETYTIKGLPEGTAYTVSESDYSTYGYTSEATSGTSLTGTVPGGANAKATVEVTNTLHEYELKIVKVAKGTTTGLTGAKFQLTRKLVGEGSFTKFENDQFEENTEDGNKKNGPFKVTSTDGIILAGLLPGDYELVETKAPDGYVITMGKFDFTIAGNGSLTPSSDCPTLITYLAAEGDDPAGYQIENEPGAALPNTGGPGTDLSYLFGIMLTGLAGGGLMMKKRRRKGA